jgi:hypothetical protein
MARDFRSLLFNCSWMNSRLQCPDQGQTARMYLCDSLNHAINKNHPKMTYFRNMKYILALIIVLKLGLVMGQDFITISGKVSDSKSLEPLPYVNLIVKKKTFATVSNQTGEFVFHIPRSSGNDTLLISFVGYEIRELAIQNIDKSKSQDIFLDPKGILLKELVVSNKRLNALDVIKEVIKKIPSNYPDQPHVLKGFFRDWRTVNFESEKGENNGVLIESAVNVIEPGYLKKGKARRESIYINEIRRSQLPEEARWNYHNSLSGLLNMNYVKYKGSKDFAVNEPVFTLPNNFVFEFSDSSNDDQYIIIEASAPNTEPMYTIFIDPSDYAIERIDFKNKKEFTRGEWTIKMINNTQRFRKLNDKWYLLYLRRNWEIEKLDSKTGKILRKEDYYMEFLVNDVLENNQYKPESLGYLADEKKPLEFQLKEYNESFWKNYNIVQENPIKSGILSFFEKNTPLIEQFRNSGKNSLIEGNETNLPEQIDNNFNWVFNKGDTLQGTLNKFRSCYDVFYYDLDIKIEPGVKEVSGSTAIHFVVKESRDKIQIDLNPSLTIQSIEWSGNPLKFSREYNAVFIQFPSHLPKETRQIISIKYKGHPLEPDFRIPNYGAFVWTEDKKGTPWIQSICQGSGANGWWPNKDHLSDKPDSVLLTVTVPSNLVNVSNGQFIGKTESGDFSTYRWKVSYPILNYNISVNAGDYVHWKEDYQGLSRLILSYYSLKENEKEAREAYKIVAPMMKTYEDCFGPYPFPLDEFKLIQSPYPMEHQSCVSVGKNFEEDLILHEAAHEWWGNSISCTDLADIWIHEAFATYAVYLFKESYYGIDQASKYLDYLAKSIKGSYPLVGRYGVNHIHYDFEDSYSKGALLLHTLRNLISDDSAWFDMLRNLQTSFRYKSINTTDLIKYLNRQSGQDFSYLFDQYLYQTGIPKFEIRVKEGKGKLSVEYRWQNVKEDFAMPVRVTIAKNKFDYIYPVTSWKSMEIENLLIDDFKVESNRLITSSVTISNP